MAQEALALQVKDHTPPRVDLLPQTALVPQDLELVKRLAYPKEVVLPSVAPPVQFSL